MTRQAGLIILLVVACAMAQAARAQEAQAQPAIEDFSERNLVMASAKYLGATAESMAEIMDSAFSRYGMPNAVIRGEEVSIAAVIGARYGRGTLIFKDGREFPIFWRGPTAGVDMGATGLKVLRWSIILTNPNSFINVSQALTARWLRWAVWL